MNWSIRAAAMAAAVTTVMAAGSLQAQTAAPRANGETLNIQNYAGTTGNMHAVVAQIAYALDAVARKRGETAEPGEAAAS